MIDISHGVRKEDTTFDILVRALKRKVSGVHWCHSHSGLRDTNQAFLEEAICIRNHKPGFSKRQLQ